MTVKEHSIRMKYYWLPPTTKEVNDHSKGQG